ncbi:hypothetical protein GCM10011349_45560 [Novosphingobium indicum]|uniref:Uncharacterized protein n=1 Tax=Novosphingobium indicum TaxID=462949 RepID=A0ABQ2K2V2_9SPHN|nr:hypothetical protein GCM10011349_45560 [Novosphingobium indicum]
MLPAAAQMGGVTYQKTENHQIASCGMCDDKDDIALRNSYTWDSALQAMTIRKPYARWAKA